LFLFRFNDFHIFVTENYDINECQATTGPYRYSTYTWTQSTTAYYDIMAMVNNETNPAAHTYISLFLGCINWLNGG
jgi:hypothetical protein